MESADCPPRLAGTFQALRATSTKRLDLDRWIALRTAPEDLHLWVSRLLGEDLEVAAELGARLRDSEFSIRLTRDLGQAKRYLTERYGEEPNALYGMLASTTPRTSRILGSQTISSRRSGSKSTGG